MKNYKLLLFLVLFFVSKTWAQETDLLLKDSKKAEGFFTYYWNENRGKVYLEVKNLGQEFLYYPSLAQGVGSNDIGLDRGKLSEEHILKFERLGNKIMLIEPNYYYRAITNDLLEKKAVEESFAKSIIFGFKILKNTDNGFIIDFTPFLLRDAIDASAAIANTKQGNYVLDSTRSGIYQPMCKSFPKNTEFEAMITLSGSKPGNYLSAVLPNANYVTINEHHSFVQLPDLSGYKPREYDPRIGYNGIEFFDYSTPVNQPIVKKFTSRHRLAKKDPSAVMSEAVEPIVYYLDSGVPEPIRAALFEGATWWNQAFEAAGYKNAFQVKMLPADADPMDIRYNLIQWVHRSTRGWSYGMSVIDPRTGEILKGKVSLGSLRVRQDYLLAQGLAGDFSQNDDSKLNKLALDRLKQLSAHEIGHTLGLPHNYISSIQGRASVMDYPHPLVFLKDGKVDLSEAYSMGIGDYDKSSIAWGYQDFPNTINEKQELEKIAINLQRKNLQFLTDQDARPDGSVHPQTHLWDNGSSAAEELKRVMNLRNFVLKDFDEKKLPKNVPMATIEEVFVPMFMFHRYQVQATAKSIAGQYYRNNLNGEPNTGFKPTSADEQKDCINTLLATLEPEFLAVPKQLLSLLSPRPFRYDANARETFKRRTGMAFDVLSPAEVSAQLTLGLLFNSQRVTRLTTQQIYDKNLPSFADVLSQTSSFLIKNPTLGKNNYYGQIKRVVADMYIKELLKLKNNESLGIEVKSNISAELKNIKIYFVKNQNILGGFADYVLEILNKPDDQLKSILNSDFLTAPDGQPIDQDYDWLGNDDCNKE